MSDTPNATEGALVSTFVAAFPGYIMKRLDALGVAATPRLDAAVAAAATRLAVALEGLLATPVSEQRQSPLELVRAATIPITKLLSDDVPHQRRDDRDVEIHPDDVFGLYPATSRDLGDVAWRAHTKWGIEKARNVAGMVPVEKDPQVKLPAVALFGLSAERREDLEPVVGNLGYQTLVWRNPAALADGLARRPILALVDVAHPTAHDAIRQLVAAGIDVVAVGTRVDDLATAGLMALGAAQVVDLDRIVHRLDDLLPRIV